MTPLEQLEQVLGGREGFVDSLAMAALDKKETEFFELLMRPENRTRSIDGIARIAGVRVKQVLEMFRSSAFVTAQALANARLVAKLPEVVQDVADKSVDAVVQCPACLGKGQYGDGNPCANCNTSGVVFRASDLDRQKLVLEATGVIKKMPGVAIQNNQQMTIQSPANFFSKYVKQSDAAAYDVEVIEPGDGESSS